jgi:hypothetical protein
MRRQRIFISKQLLRRYGQVTTISIVMALGACASGPSIQYPSGTAARAAVNSDRTSSGQVSLDPSMAAASPVDARPANTEQAVGAPHVIAMTYVVNDSEKSVLTVLRRWARADKMDFTWNVNVDYSITPKMRSIQAATFPDAVDAMRDALAGVDIPLKVALSADGLYVSLVKSSASSARSVGKAQAIYLAGPAYADNSVAPTTRTMVSSEVTAGCTNDTANTDESRCTPESARSARGDETLVRWRAKQAEANASPVPRVRRHRLAPAPA